MATMTKGRRLRGHSASAALVASACGLVGLIAISGCGGAARDSRSPVDVRGAAIQPVSSQPPSGTLTPVAPAPIPPNVDELPKPITRVAPSYPEEARNARVDGKVILQALVGEDGRVLDTRVVKSIPLLDEAAMAAVRQWRFEPGKSKGKPVEMWIDVPVQFSLR